MKQQQKNGSKVLSMRGKQLRIWVTNKVYAELKEKSKKLGLQIGQLAGLQVNGWKIQKIHEPTTPNA